ncbi:MAG TPA: STAS domain-containing protein [Anaeromyxobacteraceae bacterium]|nr:STAS domain-containing protein [Anaeromyxobacteraceae bacterium]
MRTTDEGQVEISGVFDQQAARRIADAIADLEDDGELRVDLTQVREFLPVGVAALARTISGRTRGVRVVLAGLRSSQIQMLRYLGVDFPEPASQLQH